MSNGQFHTKFMWLFFAAFLNFHSHILVFITWSLFIGAYLGGLLAAHVLKASV